MRNDLSGFLFCLLTSALCLGISGASAQGYPAKSVRVIVPASPSGGLDIMARTIGHPLSEMWGQSVVVDNRPGAGVMLGTEMASKATPDGYTLLVVNANLAPNAVLHNKLSVVQDLAGIILIANLPNVLSVNASLPVSSIKELVELAKKKPLTYASAGYGTVGNIVAEMVKIASHTDITHVPYKGGGPVMVALTGGQVSIAVVSLASTMAQAKAGRVKMLGVASSKRSRLAPDVPTISETLPSVKVESWVGMMAPRGTPAAIIRQINAAVLKAVAMPDTQKRLVSQGYDVVGSSPEAFNQLVRSDVVTYSKVIKQANIRIN